LQAPLDFPHSCLLVLHRTRVVAQARTVLPWVCSVVLDARNATPQISSAAPHETLQVAANLSNDAARLQNGEAELGDAAPALLNYATGLWNGAGCVQSAEETL